MNRLFVLTLFMVGVLLSGVKSGEAGGSLFRLGYLDHTGAALCRIAQLKGEYAQEGLKVELVRFSDSRSGLAALEQGTIHAGAFEVGEGLKAIAGGKGFRIIAGGGIPTATGLLAELDDRVQQRLDLSGIVILIPATGGAGEKETLTRLTAALVRAYRSSRAEPELLRSKSVGTDQPIIHFDPYPDYYRLERLWKRLDLHSSTFPPDFLANHVYEEIYCDALDRLLDSAPDDNVYKELSGKAVCVPDCCPKNKKQ